MKHVQQNHKHIITLNIPYYTYMENDLWLRQNPSYYGIITEEYFVNIYLKAKSCAGYGSYF
jgi:hypothetical protein